MTIAARLSAYGSTPRILGVDLARGLAMLGMFGAHVGVTGDLGLEPTSWLALVHGRSSILFALLAGVSIAIISGRITPPVGVDLLQARTRILTRAVVIFAVGGLLQFLGTNVAVILPMYALLFVLSLPFLRWRPRNLFLLAGIIAIVAPVLLLLWNANPFSPGGQSAIIDLFLTGSYPGAVWVAFVLVGLGVGRLDLASRRVAVRIALAGIVLAVVGYGAGLGAQGLVAAQPAADVAPTAEPTYSPPVHLNGSDVDLADASCDVYSDRSYFCYPDDYYDTPAATATTNGYAPPAFSVDLTQLATISPHSGTPFEVVGSTGFALVVLGLSLLVARRLRWALFPAIAVGAMALTAYSAHIVVLAVIGQSAYTQPDNWLYLAFVVGALLFCSLWTVLLGRGPLERLLSWVSRRAARLTPAPGPKLESTPNTTKAI